MKEYQKIEAIFERDIAGSKKLIIGKFRNPAIQYLANAQWVFTEKIDGTNIRIAWDGHKITFGGRTDRAQIPAHLVNKLNEMFGDVATEELFEQLFGEKEVILFGEGYGAKIQNGGLYRDDVSFILFDIMVGGIMLERENVEAIARALSIDVVPIILRGTINEAIEYVQAHPKSTIGVAPMEGLVGRPAVELRDRAGNRIIVKVKVCDFE